MKRRTKRPTKKEEEKPFIQFSKRLVTGIMLFWGVVRLWSVMAVWMNPEVSGGMTKIIQGVDDIAMVIVLSYTGNSISEKIAIGYFDMKSDQYKAELESSKDEDDENENSVG